MDRNHRAHGAAHSALVALRKESVDRNRLILLLLALQIWSLSARRAWIEISGGVCARLSVLSSLSARRAWLEICGGAYAKPLVAWSLSARRAWIEIMAHTARNTSIAVALRKESVDRNREQFKYVVQCRSRSPQGERG